MRARRLVTTSIRSVQRFSRINIFGRGSNWTKRASRRNGSPTRASRKSSSSGTPTGIACRPKPSGELRIKRARLPLRPDAANVAAVSGRKTAVVGKGKPNELGVYDMIGNVWELVWSFGDQYDPAMHTRITMLGGDFHYPADPSAAACAASPYGDQPFDGGGNIGLRLVCRQAGLPKPLAGGAIANAGYHDADVPTWVAARDTKTEARTKADTAKGPILETVRIPGGTFPFSPGRMLPFEAAVHPFEMARCADHVRPVEPRLPLGGGPRLPLQPHGRHGQHVLVPVRPLPAGTRDAYHLVRYCRVV